MLKNKNIIHLSNVFWEETWFSKQALALEFSKNNRVLYVNPPVNIFSCFKNRKRVSYFFKNLHRLSKNLIVYTPIILLPLHRLLFTLNLNSKILLGLVKKIQKRFKYENSILWINAPEYFSLVKSNLKEKISVYHCTDEYAAMPGINRKLIFEAERILLAKVDLVIAVSPVLVDRKRRFNPHTYFISNACDSSYFKKRTYQIPGDLEKISRPRIGFSGSINARIDVDLIEKMVKEKPDWQFVFVGPKGMRYFIEEEYNRLKNLKNVHLLGARSKEVLPQYVNFFDVCIIPYKDNEFNGCSCPLKVYEYLALGKPIVSSNIPAFEGLKEIVYLSYNHSEFVQNIEKTLKEDDPGYKKRRIKIAKQNTWENRIEEVSKIIQKHLEMKK